MLEQVARLITEQGFDVWVPTAQTCCGALHAHFGHIDEGKKLVAQNVAAFQARQVDAVITNSAGCGSAMKDWGHHVEGAETQAFSASVRDISEFLFELRKAGHFKEDFKSTPDGPVAYHAPCHLRKQQVGFRGRDLMRRIPGVKPKLVQECCGHDGTWAMKTEYFELSKKYELFDEDPELAEQVLHVMRSFAHLTPDHAKLHGAIGGLEEYLGKTEEAVLAYERYLRLVPWNEKIRVHVQDLKKRLK